MSKDRVGVKATTIHAEGGFFVVRLYKTEVVKFNKESVILNSGGYKTSLTKRRMNEASKQFDLGYRVIQENKKWRIVTDAGKNIEFVDNIVIERN